MAVKHVIQNQKLEIILAFLLLIVGFFLMWDAWNNRGGDVPWYLQWLSFW